MGRGGAGAAADCSGVKEQTDPGAMIAATRREPNEYCALLLLLLLRLLVPPGAAAAAATPANNREMPSATAALRVGASSRGVCCRMEAVEEVSFPGFVRLVRHMSETEVTFFLFLFLCWLLG